MTELDRLTTIAERLELKASTERALIRAGGGVNFHFYTRVATTQLHRYGAADEKDFIPLDVAVELDRKAGVPIAIGTAARLLGYRLEPLTGEAGTQCLAEAISGAIRECSDVYTKAIDATADDRITPVERRDINTEIDEAVESLQRLRQIVGRAG